MLIYEHIEMKKCILSVLFLCCMATQAQNAMSLSDCIEKALESNYEIKIAKNDDIANRNDVNYGQFMPTLSGSGSQRESNMDSKRTDASGEDRNFSNSITRNLSANVNLNWRIFDGLAMFTTLAKRKEFVRMGELKTQLAVENLIARVNNGYYNVLVQQELLRASIQTYRLSEQRYRAAQKKYALGTLSGLELRQSKLDLNADSSRLAEQHELLRSAYINLNTLMNGDLQAIGYVKDSIVLLPMLQREDVENQMLVNNTSLQLAKKDIRVTELDLKLARAALFPTLDFSTGYSYSQAKTPSSISTYSQSNGFFWGFTLNVPLFNQLENKRKIKNAQIDIENKDLTYQELELQTRSDMAQLYNSYENSLLMVGFETESANVAYETLLAAMERYRLGNLSGLEFREFQRSYLDAITRKVTAEFQAKSAEISLLLLSGNFKL